MKLNARGGVEGVRQELDVLLRILRNWRGAFNDASSWRRWARRVSRAERGRKIDGEMARTKGSRIRGKFIVKHGPLTAPL
jgi:hypothetical protein